VAVASAIFGVASAGAEITTTSITSPSSPYIYVYNNDTTPQPTQTITGTTDSTAPGSDTVDIRCYYGYLGGYDYNGVASNVPTAADGSFSWTGVVDQGGVTCTLRAVPHGGGISSPASFPGPMSELDSLFTYHTSGTGTPEYNYYYSASGSNGDGYFDSAGDCGVGMSPLKPGTGAYAGNGWNCAASLPSSDGLNGRTNVLIDGRNAYTSDGAEFAYVNSGTGHNSGQAAGFPALSSSYARSNDVSGNATITESQGLVSCANSTFPATLAKCGGTSSNDGTWQSDGVSLSRTIQQGNQGQLETVTDTYSSTDGTAHNIDIEYSNPSNGGSWKFPGSSGYQEYAPGDSVSLAGDSMDAIYTGYGDADSNPNTSSSSALIYTTQPNAAVFNQDGELLLDYQRQVPAGGSITITHLYIAGWNAAATNAAANSIASGVHKPVVSITHPSNGTVTAQSAVEVSGTASAHDGLTLKVNGATVAVNPDGTWATTRALNSGTNTITAIASDGSGNTAQATDTVIYSPTKQQTFCIVPNVTHNKLAKAKAALKKAGCKVGKIKKVHSSKFRKGTVEHASNSANVVLKAGTKVGLTESVGKAKKSKKHSVRRSHMR
jgi:hypothetical protein